MVFLGTPFRGSSAAKPAEAVRRVLQLFKVDTQRQTLKLLGVDSERLGELNRAFPQVLNKRRSSKDIDHQIEASFFYETLKTSWGVGSVQVWHLPFKPHPSHGTDTEIFAFRSSNPTPLNFMDVAMPRLFALITLTSASSRRRMLKAMPLLWRQFGKP
jgi:hypothetical protein